MRSQVWEEFKEGCSKQRYEQQVQKPKGGQELASPGGGESDRVVWHG